MVAMPAESIRGATWAMTSDRGRQDSPLALAINHVPACECVQCDLFFSQLRTRTFWRSGVATATSANLQKESALR
jgi:hypothetical protein